MWTIRRLRRAKPKCHWASLPSNSSGILEDAETLRIKLADEFPAATDQRYIDRMIEMMARLSRAVPAYQAEDKSVYFRIKFAMKACAFRSYPTAIDRTREARRIR
jgi:cysteinyl-tRNA synthetase